MKLYAALHENGRLEVDYEHPVGLISRVIEAEEGDPRYRLLYRSMTDQQFGLALGEMFEGLFIAGKIAGTQSREMTSATH